MQQHFFSKEFIELDFVPTFFSLVNKLGFGRKTTKWLVPLPTKYISEEYNLQFIKCFTFPKKEKCYVVFILS